MAATRVTSVSQVGVMASRGHGVSAAAGDDYGWVVAGRRFGSDIACMHPDSDGHWHYFRVGLCAYMEKMATEMTPKSGK